MYARTRIPSLLAACAALTVASAMPALAQCGAERQWPCVCRGTIRVGPIRIPYPYPCCDGGYAMDAAVGFRCSSCSVGNPGYNCTGDGRGREGENEWVPLSSEWLRTGGRLSDRGLIGRYNFTRHTAEINA